MRWPFPSFTCPGSNGSIMRCSAAMRRIHLSDLMLIGARPVQVFLETTMFGNFEVMSLADSAIFTASLRPIAR
jgi:hypothetical protein